MHQYDARALKLGLLSTSTSTPLPTRPFTPLKPMLPVQSVQDRMAAYRAIPSLKGGAK
jgi:hypothetical protein